MTCTCHDLGCTSCDPDLTIPAAELDDCWAAIKVAAFVLLVVAIIAAGSWMGVAR